MSKDYIHFDRINITKKEHVFQKKVRGGGEDKEENIKGTNAIS